MMHVEERRQRRSDDPQQALGYQLEVSRMAGGLEAMVLADELGCCVATAGDPDICAEIAARLPTIGGKVADFEGILLGPGLRWDIHVRRFEVPGGELFMCAVGGGRRRMPELERSIGGAARILS